jgi:hypothetical protein
MLLWVCVPAIGGSRATAMQADDLETWGRSFPASMAYDLPAMTLRAEELPATGLVASNGRLLRPVEEAATFAPLLGVEQDALLQEMRDAGWKSRYIAEAARASTANPDQYSTVGWSSITEYEDAAGAKEGFAILDESDGEGVEVLQAQGVGEASRITRYVGTAEDGRSFARVRYTFVHDALVGSVAVYWYDEATAVASDAADMVAPAQRLLERMQEAVAGEALNLPGMVVRMSPSAELDIDTHDEAYYTLEGTAIPHYGDSLAALQDAAAFLDRWGIEANYLSRTLFAAAPVDQHGPYFMVQLFRLGNADNAAALVRGHMQYDDISGYIELNELDELPDVDGAVAGVSYVYEWDDGSTDRGYRVWVQVGRTVAVVEASDPDGVEQALMFDLVERQVGCLEFGACEPIPVPFPVSSAPAATPAA